MLDQKTARQIAKRYAAEVCNIFTPASVILFGSCVNGTLNEDSDIDIAVVVHGSDSLPVDWYDARILLCKLLRKTKDFIGIEPHLLDANNDPSGFVEHVIKTGEVIYSAA